MDPNFVCLVLLLALSLHIYSYYEIMLNDKNLSTQCHLKVYDSHAPCCAILVDFHYILMGSEKMEM